MKIILEQATDIERDERGVIYSWRGVPDSRKEFDSWQDFTTYVQGLPSLKDMTAFSGSAITTIKANAFIRHCKEAQS